MPWILVILSGLLEAGWAIGLKASAGLTRPLPAALTLLGMIASFAMLAVAARSLPIGTAYAVWVGIGALGAVILGVVLYGEAMTLGRAVSLLLVLLGIVGLKLSDASH
ncbi:MAG: multidrug efflux SMR transporter [Myxococcales bacterium]|nr:multidrug efflux SMR transporter [Myxococcales bacterium]